MPKLLQINITANWGSHGRIAEEIGQLALSQGWESHIAYGRWANSSQSQLYHIGSMWDERWHGLQSRLFDNHGLASLSMTEIEELFEGKRQRSRRNLVRGGPIRVKITICHLAGIKGFTSYF